MSVQLYKAMADILAMPYFKNEHHRSGGVSFGHEEAVATKIKGAGFKEFDKSNFKKVTKSLLKKWSKSGNDTDLQAATVGLPNGSYIVQPSGSQGFPDILVKDFCGRFVAVECKSGKNGTCPMWNDNVPQQQAIYILSSGLMNATTAFLGRDVITPAAYTLMAQQEAEIEQIVKKYNALMGTVDTFNRGWFQKSRKQHFQGGGKEKTNYFTHINRSQCEKNALDYAKQ